MKILFTSILIFVINVSIAQKVLVLDSNVDKVNLLEYSYIYTESNSECSINDVLNKEWNYFGEIPSFPPSNNSVWLRYSFKNNTDVDIDKVFFIPYYLIHTIDAYILEDSSLISIAKTGIMRNKFSKGNSIIGYPIDLNIKQNSFLSIYVKYNHLYRPLRATSYLLNKQTMIDIERSSNNYLWLWRGVYGFALIVSLILYGVVRRNIFLYYSLLILGINLFVFSHVGDLFFFLDSDPTDISSAIDYTGAFFISFSLVLFLNELTPLKENNKIMWKVIYYLVYGMIPLVLLSYFPSVRISAFTIITHNYIMVVSAFVFISQMYFLIKNIYLKERNAIILTIIYTIYLASGFVDVILPNIAVLGDSTFVYSVFILGSFIEIFLFMLLVIKETEQVYSQRSDLLMKQKNHQKEIILTMVNSIEEERNRTGREIHDLIGANMAIIKHSIDRTSDIIPIIDQTIDTVRNLSHGLVAPLVNNDEFVDEINQLAHLFSTKEQKVYVYFHQWPVIDNKESVTHIYRICQELLKNAQKHSKASNVYLQFIGQVDKSISVYYEDDGVGFDKNKQSSKGLGFRNIKNRVRILHGNIIIESSPKNGTVIIIEMQNK
ncbi:MAG: hypothetical protein DRI86_03995 [Bacteroidetes bacterium]|nr:MAG: hypothetical protein DRI86_03995 [Bacteroidota bacterium]